MSTRHMTLYLNHLSPSVQSLITRTYGLSYEFSACLIAVLVATAYTQMCVTGTSAQLHATCNCHIMAVSVVDLHNHSPCEEFFQ